MRDCPLAGLASARDAASGRKRRQRAPETRRTCCTRDVLRVKEHLRARRSQQQSDKL